MPLLSEATASAENKVQQQGQAAQAINPIAPAPEYSGVVNEAQQQFNTAASGMDAPASGFVDASGFGEGAIPGGPPPTDTIKAEADPSGEGNLPTETDPSTGIQPTIGAQDPTLQDLYPDETVTPTISTPQDVESQRVDAELARILGQDSPLLARARAEAAQHSNRRGLLNSSMAASAAQGAMVDRALPMAQQNVEASTRAAAMQADLENQNLQQRVAAITQLNEQYLQGTQAMDLETIRGTYQQILSTNEAAANLYKSYLDGISSVMDDPKMKSDQVASAVNTMQKMLEASLRMISEMNDLDIDTVGGEPVTAPAVDQNIIDNFNTPPTPGTTPGVTPLPTPGLNPLIGG